MRNLVESTPNLATLMGRGVLRRAGPFLPLFSPFGLCPLPPSVAQTAIPRPQISAPSRAAYDLNQNLFKLSRVRSPTTP
jgi:hypothetical protein